MVRRLPVAHLPMSTIARLLAIAIASMAGTALPTAVAAAETACTEKIAVEAEPRGPVGAKMRRIATASSTPAGATLVMGDSIAARWPRPDLEHIFATPIVNFGVGGDRIENTLAILDTVQDKVKAPANVLLVVGTNNIRHDPPCAFEAKIETLLKATRHAFPSARIVILEVLPKGVGGRAFAGEIGEANRIYHATASRYRVRVVSAHDVVASACGGVESCPLFGPDRLHPTKAGYDLLDRSLRDIVRGAP